MPLVSGPLELRDQADLARATVAAVLKERGAVGMGVRVGTMLEVPRAALTADQIAESAEFFRRVGWSCTASSDAAIRCLHNPRAAPWILAT